jgi:hypothetical protein
VATAPGGALSAIVTVAAIGARCARSERQSAFARRNDLQPGSHRPHACRLATARRRDLRLGLQAALFARPGRRRPVARFRRRGLGRRAGLRTLEKVAASYVSDDLREREDDIVWRLRHRGDWLYVYLLLEFQSSVDPWMALRIMVYTGLLYQDLIKSGEIGSQQKLPAVFPLVLYNGRRRWTAAREVSELIEPLPASLKPYHPAQRYFLLEEAALGDAELTTRRTRSPVSFVSKLAARRRTCGERCHCCRSVCRGRNTRVCAALSSSGSTASCCAG